MRPHLRFVLAAVLLAVTGGLLHVRSSREIIAPRQPLAGVSS